MCLLNKKKKSTRILFKIVLRNTNILKKYEKKKIAVRRVRNYNDPKNAQLPMHCLGKPLLTATILVYRIT